MTIEKGKIKIQSTDFDPEVDEYGIPKLPWWHIETETHIYRSHSLSGVFKLYREQDDESKVISCGKVW